MLGEENVNFINWSSSVQVTLELKQHCNQKDDSISITGFIIIFQCMRLEDAMSIEVLPNV